jgi:hypothetical protein
VAPAGFCVSVPHLHLLLVAMLAMLAVVIAVVRFYDRDERCFFVRSWRSLKIRSSRSA